MSQPALQTFERRTIAVDVGGSAVTSLADSILTYDGSFGTETDTVEDNADSAYLGGKSVSITNNRGFIEAGIRLVSPAVPGTNPAAVAKLLYPCGFAQTLTAGSAGTGKTSYTPVSASFALADAKMWQGGRLISVTDARGELSEIKGEIGTKMSAKFRLQGTYADLTDVAQPTDAAPDISQASVATHLNSTLILDSLGDTAITALHLRAKSLSYSLGNEIATQEYTEFKETAINARKPTFTARFANPAMADFNPEKIRDLGELITLKWRTTEADDHYVELGIRGQILAVNVVNIDGKAGIEITGTCIPSSAGGDEVYIENGY